MVKLGSTVKDKITGFVGIATGVVNYITGCNQVLVQPKVETDGKFGDPRWFDEQRLIVDEGVAVIVIDNGTTNGADLAAPSK